MNIKLPVYVLCAAFALTTVAAQELQQPQPKFEYACISESFNSFSVDIAFTGGSFDSGNVFYVELSDKNGSFTQAELLTTVSGQNQAYNFTAAFALPVEVQGDGYKIRVRSTAPAVVSPESAAFSAYFIPSEPLVLNNYESMSVCEAATALLELNVEAASVYHWYRNGTLFAETSEAFLEVDISGQYYVEPYYGPCTGTVRSNLVNVESASAFSVEISGPSSVMACEGTAISLAATVDDAAYAYQWYYNGEEISGNASYEPVLEVTAGAGAYGEYTVVVTNSSGCTAVSDPVTLSPYPETEMFAVSSLNAILLGNASATLSITTNLSNKMVSWYKNGELYQEAVDLFELTVTEEGVYYAQIDDPSPCSSVLRSPDFTVFIPLEYIGTIGHSQPFLQCETTTTDLEIQRITAILSNGDEVVVTQDHYAGFSFEWYADGLSTGIVTPVLSLESYLESGDYTLEFTEDGKVYTTNTMEVNLGIPSPELIQATPLTCMEPALLQVTSTDDVIYNWYIDDALAASTLEPEFTAHTPGNYTVEVEYAGCISSGVSLEVGDESDLGVSVYPGDRVTLVPGKSVMLWAEGGITYSWTDASGAVLSENSTLEVAEEGTYKVAVSTGDCNTIKEVNVYYDLARGIPNIVTPNNDLVNDTWALPQVLLNDPSLEVIICDAYGNRVLQTNTYDNSWPSSAVSAASENPTYFYVLKKNGQDLGKGAITLIY